ncbi:CYTH and CHAD domain-containing protein [Arthrobacter crystallopoietes]|uniref:CYTH and CHAD domain-containing protein n=1 Tax=Crystallibacter crystallopoietes TaxID=37928 RepID=UPI001ABDDFE3|nr:CYTH and CHAD domain-containing protein [Arthrobacter crystallopoietes]QTG80405.1 CYTH and CHAD domain-containing protein [Arthrobacter crystallopoietes]
MASDCGYGTKTGRAFVVEESAPLPALHTLPGVNRVEQGVEAEFEAVYFDTNDFVLAARGITLERRTGPQACWQLEQPADDGERRVSSSPPGRGTDGVPKTLLQLVRVHVRDKPLVPVTRVLTRRVLHRLRGSGDQVLANILDDHLRSEQQGSSSGDRRWREWAIELVEGNQDLLDACNALCAGSGAQRGSRGSTRRSELAQHSRQPVQAAPPPKRKGDAAAVVLFFLDQQVRSLKEQDPPVRSGEPEGVHKMRVASRRLRSCLATYRKLLAGDTVGGLRGELKWLADLLGEARDAQVIQDRLRDVLAREPAELVLGPVARRIDEQLTADLKAARTKTLRALDTKRYFRLLDALDALLADPPLTALAAEPAREVIGRRVKREAKRLRRVVTAVEQLPGGATDAHALHEVRIGAKRLRYAAEAAIPVGGKRAQRLAEAAQRVQQSLGVHQDTVLTRDLLRRLGAGVVLQNENGFSYGRLHALEQFAAENAEAAFRREWKRFPSTSINP